MIIRLTKGNNATPPVLTCVRDDGSVTYRAGSEFFARHDLLHYAVETTLGYRQAFFGMVADGRDIADFGTRNGRPDTYSDEALWAEQIVGVLQWSLIGADASPTDAELVERLAQTCVNQGVASPLVTSAQMQQIHSLARELHSRWDTLGAGALLELHFP